MIITYHYKNSKQSKFDYFKNIKGFLISYYLILFTRISDYNFEQGFPSINWSR